ncbi:Fibronectin type 3 and ankyrin repeat domains protein 1 [Galemys pyrenaicus]|uniref:Fibronectin type 3 and ankyrin repeat domains protein 1 n=1 Tax=Galemys pyrenaicus TaxID=202257 RepID=A0A8J6DQU6_GALPY|nr:Fibronectin type 3 and ankyrin repeat domains protein 1 [Galemys pyrenaicus]
MRVSAVSGNQQVASLLIEAGADVNMRDKDGKTPLMVRPPPRARLCAVWPQLLPGRRTGPGGGLCRFPGSQPSLQAPLHTHVPVAAAPLVGPRAGLEKAAACVSAPGPPQRPHRRRGGQRPGSPAAAGPGRPAGTRRAPLAPLGGRPEQPRGVGPVAAREGGRRDCEK